MQPRPAKPCTTDVRARRLLLAWVLLFAPAPAVRAADAAWVAPLGARTQGSFRELFLDVTIADARVPRRPQLDVRWTVANDWSMPTLVTRGGAAVVMSTDEQADTLTLSLELPWSLLARGDGRLSALARRVSTAIEWRLTEHWGGWTDAPIESWHAAINVFDFHRTSYPRGRVRLALGELGARPALDVRSACFATGDLVARTRIALARGAPDDRGRERWGVALRLDLKAPLGRLSDAGGSGGWDAGAALVASADVTPWMTAHVMAALARWSALRSVPLRPRPVHGTAEISVVLHHWGFALLLEDRLVSPVFERWSPALPSTDPGARSTAYVAAFERHNQVSVGVRRGRLTAWVSEDFTPGTAYGREAGWFFASNAPDVLVGLAYTQQF